MSTDTKLSNTQLGEVNQSSRFLGKTLGNLDKKALLDLVVPLV